MASHLHSALAEQGSGSAAPRPLPCADVMMLLQDGAVLVKDVYPDTRSSFGKLLDFLRGRNAGMAATGSLEPLAAALLGTLESAGRQQQQQQLLLEALLWSLQLPGFQGQGGMGPQAYSVEAQRLLSSLRG